MTLNIQLELSLWMIWEQNNQCNILGNKATVTIFPTQKAWIYGGSVSNSINKCGI